MEVFVLTKNSLNDDVEQDNSIIGVYTENAKILLENEWLATAKKEFIQEIKNVKRFLEEIQYKLASNKNNDPFINLWNSQWTSRLEELNRIQEINTDEEYIKYYRLKNDYFWESFKLEGYDG